MPGDRFFIDSTTFLYTLDRSEPVKGQTARSWLRMLVERDAGITSLQVLNEVANVVIRKTARFGSPDPFWIVDTFAGFGSSPLMPETALEARHVFKVYRYSWWDCLLLASALDLGCTHFLSEDLQDGQRIENGRGRALTIVSPFAHRPERLLAPR